VLVGLWASGLLPFRATEIARADSFANNGGVVAANLSLSSLETKTFSLINEERQAKGRKQLVWDEDLGRMARRHSDSMVRHDFFAHSGPDGAMLERAQFSGVPKCKALGENIAYNLGYSDPATFAVKHWIDSAGHHDNILRRSFTHTGVGVARAADGRVFFTQVFAAR
jgi:uncharacterized protein YkwD